MRDNFIYFIWLKDMFMISHQHFCSFSFVWVFNEYYIISLLCSYCCSFILLLSSSFSFGYPTLSPSFSLFINLFYCLYTFLFFFLIVLYLYLSFSLSSKFIVYSEALIHLDTLFVFTVNILIILLSVNMFVWLQFSMYILFFSLYSHMWILF